MGKIGADRMREEEMRASESVVETHEAASLRNVNELIGRLTKESFQGLVCAFSIKGEVFYTNDRFRFLSGVEREACGFFNYIVPRERSPVVQMFREVYSRKVVVKKIDCRIPLTVGRYEVDKVHVRAELSTFSEGLILKIPDTVLINIKEMELEKLKLLLLKSPNRGLWITDDKGVIVDLLKTNCEKKLGWTESDVIGRNISFLTNREHFRHISEDVYFLDRLQKDGGSLRTEVVEGRVTLSNGHVYWIYLDTYF